MDDKYVQFENAYKGTPKWDIGRPQSAYVALAQVGQIQGSILDVGCGTGDNALFFAEQGYEVWGIDFSPTAIEKAKKKASLRQVQVTFRVVNALNLQEIKRTFDTVIDSGLFHVFSDEGRSAFIKSLKKVLKPGGKYYLLCFGDQRRATGRMPRRVSQEEIYAAFHDRWSVDAIHSVRFETTFSTDGVPGWLASITSLWCNSEH